jgi:hypothetical protein
MNSAETSNKLSEILLGKPSEEVLYGSHFKKEIWSLEQFAALVAGISPERMKSILTQRETAFTEIDLQRISNAIKIKKSS